MILGSNITMEEYGQVQRENGRLEGLQEGKQEGLQEGLLKGITVLIQDNLEEGISKERILSKLTSKFHLTNDEAVDYYERATKEL